MVSESCDELLQQSGDRTASGVERCSTEKLFWSIKVRFKVFALKFKDFRAKSLNLASAINANTAPFRGIGWKPEVNVSQEYHQTRLLRENNPNNPGTFFRILAFVPGSSFLVQGFCS